ncbi:hypothetical protein AB0J28_00550 [Streptosporangium canum]|uniref:hypothetical protein n=1 Tax=Streptosporangium canum TaxID=324952 RepID=UPI003442319D
MTDHIDVEAWDEHGHHITRLIPGEPPATDHTYIPTAELVALRAEVARLRAGEELERMTIAARLANGHALEAEATITRVRAFADQISKGSRAVSREFVAQGLLRLVDGEVT